MGLGLALFIIFCSSVFFAVHVHSVVQSFSCIKSTDVNPSAFYSCDNLWLIIDLLAGNKHILCYLAELVLINPMHFCLRHALFRWASSTADFSHHLVGALVRSYVKPSLWCTKQGWQWEEAEVDCRACLMLWCPLTSVAGLLSDSHSATPEEMSGQEKEKCGPVTPKDGWHG